MTATITVAPRPTRARAGRRGRALVVLLAAIGVVAFLVRLSIAVRGGGLTGLGSYDDGVYYAAADALVHGRLPYRDFLLIQPPLIAVVTAPFAALGTVISDPVGFAVARVAFVAIGAINAVLCGAILRRFGLTAVIVGGFGYALFFPAAYSERSVLLEPLGTLGVLLAILLLQHAPAHRSLAVVAGITAGLATGAKIWYVVPAALLVLAVPRLRLRLRLRYGIGVAIGGCAIYLPFLAAAPQRMVQQVVLDQLGRGGGAVAGPLHRVVAILGVRTTAGVPAALIAPTVLMVVVVAVLVALRTPGARSFGVLAIGTGLVLLLSPSWFEHYTALTAPFITLCVGVAAGRLGRLLPDRSARSVLAVVVLLGVLLANEANDRTAHGVRTPAGLARAASVVTGCITADDPGTLIGMNVLSRDLRDPTCTVWPDVSGWTYDPKDRARTTTGRTLARPLSTRWQHDALAFMESGRATVRTRHGTGFSSSSKRVVDDGPVLFRDGRFVLHATRRS